MPGEDSEAADLEEIDAFGLPTVAYRGDADSGLGEPDDDGDDPGDPAIPAAEILDPPPANETSEASLRGDVAGADATIGDCGRRGGILPSRVPGAPATTLFSWAWTDEGTQDGRPWVKIQFDVRTVVPFQAKARWAGLAMSALDPVPGTNRSFTFTTSATRDKSRVAKKPWYYHASLRVWMEG